MPIKCPDIRPIYGPRFTVVNKLSVQLYTIDGKQYVLIKLYAGHLW